MDGKYRPWRPLSWLRHWLIIYSYFFFALKRHQSSQWCSCCWSTCCLKQPLAGLVMSPNINWHKHPKTNCTNITDTSEMMISYATLLHCCEPCYNHVCFHLWGLATFSWRKKNPIYVPRCSQASHACAPRNQWPIVYKISKERICFSRF
jgi:hypothetical protein